MSFSKETDMVCNTVVLRYNLMYLGIL
jgi:hypothetical protein